MDGWHAGVTLVFLLGCGNDSASPDAAVDAYVNPLGRSCGDITPCPAGSECISIDGSTRMFCSTPCAGPTDKSCGASYSGPGKAMCTIRRGGTEPTHCGVVCSDPGNDVCSATTCDGMCPGSLQCGSDTGLGVALCE